MSKVSAYCLGKITKDYVMLPAGCAIGTGVGPKLIAKEPFALDSLHDKVVAVPGEETSAYLLMQILLEKPKKVIFLPYHEIVSSILSKKCDAGVIIHETRFSFQVQGLCELADLGTLFSSRFSLPIPLGMVVIKRSLGKTFADEAAESIQRSITYSRKQPQSLKKEILELSQEKDEKIIQSHIDLYVNDETYEISKEGIFAIRALFTLAIERGLLDESALEFSTW